MSNEKKYYCFCSSNCKYETMTKEQIMAAIAQAVETGSVGNCDTGFVTKLKEKNGGNYLSVWIGTQAQYNAIETPAANCLYIITDDTTNADMIKAVNDAAVNAANAATAAGGAAAVCEAMKAVDITNKISLSAPAGYPTLSYLGARPVKYVYSPALGIVFFTAQVTYEGTLQTGVTLNFSHVGGYAPNECEIYATLNKPDDFIASYVGYDDMHRLSIATKKNIDTGATAKTLVVNGWYFCDGE